MGPWWQCSMPYQVEGSFSACSNPASPVLGGRNVTGAAGATATGATAAGRTGVGVLLRVPLKMPCGTCWKTWGMTGITTGTTVGVIVGVAVGVSGALTTRFAVAGATAANSFEVNWLVVLTFVPGAAEVTGMLIAQLPLAGIEPLVRLTPVPPIAATRVPP